MRDFDDNDFPLAYFITFRCYGTWLHGDARGSMDPRHNLYREPPLLPNVVRERSARDRMKHAPTELTSAMRGVVDRSIREHAIEKDWIVHALSVRTNHVHVVASADLRPEQIMAAMKARATRVLRTAN